MTECNECIYTYYSSSRCNQKLLLLFRVNRTLYHLRRILINSWKQFKSDELKYPVFNIN